MERLLTKCCMAEPKAMDNGGGATLLYCEGCKSTGVHLDWVEFCDGCNKPDRYCDCP